ncbi:ATP-binding protein, partial [Caballeronia sordidicola]|uniref:ATP-binding protein n=1 Tax=Caballeronia sordidicola TaxID=196367 RepID=UPI000B7958DA
GTDRDLILTVPGRGYRLLQRRKTVLSPETASQASGGRPLPPSTSKLFGRDCAVKQIRSMLANSHVLTLVGAGGIGKTTLAVEAARHCSADFDEAVCLVELAALTKPEDVIGAIVEGCGLTLPGPRADVAQVVAALGRQRKLLVLDNAEHVIAAVAHIVDALVVGNDMLRVLVTSTEPLRIMPEVVFRVDPLGVPAAGSTDAEILQCSAVNLFFLRASFLQREVGVDSAQIRLVGEICRRLDGIPLAIELAAARVVALGVEGVHRRLDDRMAILAGGYRTALPRHQTLRATFDWSFAILDTSTRTIFRRVAIFDGSFTIEMMCEVVCDDEYSVASAITGITELVAKSLVNVEFEGPVAKYRLCESTRAYALEKLHAEGEFQAMTARNSHYLSSFFEPQTGADLNEETINPADLNRHSKMRASSSTEPSLRTATCESASN